MESYKNKGIKEIIDKFPVIEKILDDYGIGCGPCTVGVCQLKDILDIHALSKEKEDELMTRIEAAIYPDRGIKVAVKRTPSSASERDIEYSSPMQRLVDEHTLIKRWLAMIPHVVANLALDTDTGRKTILDGIDLIRSYADRLHHAKEEDILFSYFDDSAEIFQVIYEDHKQARHHVQEMLAAIDHLDSQVLGRHLNAYAKLLTEHIKKEDEILFPWLDSKLTATQKEELSVKFDREEKRINTDTEKYESFVNQLEKQWTSRN